MKLYNTCDGVLNLVPAADGLLYDPNTNHSYEASLCGEVEVGDRTLIRINYERYSEGVWVDQDNLWSTKDFVKNSPLVKSYEVLVQGNVEFKIVPEERIGSGCYVYRNQADRDGVILAQIGERLLIEYEMPNGTSALNIVDVFDYDKYETMPYHKLLKNKAWFAAWKAGGIKLIANPQKQRWSGLGSDYLNTFK